MQRQQAWVCPGSQAHGALLKWGDTAAVRKAVRGAQAGEHPDLTVGNVRRSGNVRPASVTMRLACISMDPDTPNVWFDEVLFVRGKCS